MVASMGDSLNSTVLAIDGGGTRCRVAASAGDAPVFVETGPANVSTDFDGAVREVLDGLTRLADQMGLPLEALSGLPAFVGLAGVTGPEIADRLRDALPFANARFEDDRPAALRGALGSTDGVIAHCGTGSFFAAQIGGTIRLSGGWGPVLGDEASAQWIGRTALRMSLESIDGQRVSSPLSKHLLSRFDGPAGLVRFAGAARPSEFGSLAPLVTQNAESGDAMARDVMQSGADQIARTLPLIGWAPGLAICLTGGIGPHFRAYLPNDMKSCVIAPKGEPLAGALSLASDLARESLP